MFSPLTFGEVLRFLPFINKAGIAWLAVTSLSSRWIPANTPSTVTSEKADLHCAFLRENMAGSCFHNLHAGRILAISHSSFYLIK
jgi:hypothetical protein